MLINDAADIRYTLFDEHLNENQEKDWLSDKLSSHLTHPPPQVSKKAFMSKYLRQRKLKDIPTKSTFPFF